MLAIEIFARNKKKGLSKIQVTILFILWTM